MIVRYLGHASFWISSSKGTSVVCDPYASWIPYSFPPIDADVVVISHEHRGHNADYRVGGNPLVVKRTHDFQCEHELVVARTEEKVAFHGIPTFHDNYNGRKYGPNTVWHWYWEGIHYAHLGGLGHLLTDPQVQTIGKVDILFIPIGGKTTLNPTEAVLVINQLSPRMVFPMHFLTDEIAGHGLCENRLGDFLDKMSNVEDTSTMAVEVDLARLPSETKVMVLKHE